MAATSTTMFELRPLAGAEGPGGAGVDGEEDRQLPLLAEPLDERRAGPRGDVPVDGADVVARLILADFVELHAPAAEHALVLAGEEVVDRAVGDDLDPSDLLEDRGNVLAWRGVVKD